MWTMFFVFLGFALFFWVITYLPDFLEEQKLEQAKQHLKDCFRFGAHSVPMWMREQADKDRFKQKIMKMAADAGLTPEEAELWVSGDGVLGALMTIPAEFERRKIKDEETEKYTAELAQEAALGWMRLYRNGLGPNRTPL